MFSDKYGYAPAKPIQHECVSDVLRTRIWNLFYQQEIKSGGLSSKRFSQALNGEQTIEEKIADRMGFLIDSANKSTTVEAQLKNSILKTFPWFQIYDFMDIHLSFLLPNDRTKRSAQYNELLEQERSGYRVVNGAVEPITNKHEIDIIESASNSPYPSVNEHLQKALEFYGDRKNPDYENSIKESISAVEAMCCIITSERSTLNKAIKKLKDKGMHIHPCLENAMIQLYAYTCDESGIRHGGIDFTNAPAEDAKYMLVSCSAFVNYLIEKWSKVIQGA